MASVKLQTTLTGFSAWSLAKLASIKGKSQAEIASYVLERWIDENHAYLDMHGINYQQFEIDERGGRVVAMNEHSKDG